MPQAQKTNNHGALPTAAKHLSKNTLVDVQVAMHSRSATRSPDNPTHRPPQVRSNWSLLPGAQWQYHTWSCKQITPSIIDIGLVIRQHLHSIHGWGLWYWRGTEMKVRWPEDAGFFRAALTSLLFWPHHWMATKMNDGSSFSPMQAQTKGCSGCFYVWNERF